jgi:hypothetical protein
MANSLREMLSLRLLSHKESGMNHSFLSCGTLFVIYKPNAHNPHRNCRYLDHSSFSVQMSFHRLKYSYPVQESNISSMEYFGKGNTMLMKMKC